MLEKGNGLENKPVEADLVDEQRPRARIVEQSSHRGRDSLSALDASFDLQRVLFVSDFPSLHLQVRHDAKQRIIDLMRGAECQWCERSILFVIAELCLELQFLTFELPFFLKFADKFLLGLVTLVFSQRREFMSLLQFFPDSHKVVNSEQEHHDPENKHADDDSQKCDTERNRLGQPARTQQSRQNQQDSGDQQANEQGLDGRVALTEDTCTMSLTGHKTSASSLAR